MNFRHMNSARNFSIMAVGASSQYHHRPAKTEDINWRLQKGISLLNKAEAMKLQNLCIYESVMLKLDRNKYLSGHRSHSDGFY